MQSAVMYWIILNTLLSLCILLNDQSNDFANMMSSSHAIEIFLELMQLSSRTICLGFGPYGKAYNIVNVKQ